MKNLIAILLAVFISACAMDTTQSTQTVDDRPRIALDIYINSNWQAYDLYVDNVLYGPIDKFYAQEKALPLLPGEHLIEVKKKNRIVFSDSVFLAEGTLRVFKVTDDE